MNVSGWLSKLVDPLRESNPSLQCKVTRRRWPELASLVCPPCKVTKGTLLSTVWGRLWVLPQIGAVSPAVSSTSHPLAPHLQDSGACTRLAARTVRMRTGARRHPALGLAAFPVNFVAGCCPSVNRAGPWKRRELLSPAPGPESETQGGDLA